MVLILGQVFARAREADWRARRMAEFGHWLRPAWYFTFLVAPMGFCVPQQCYDELLQHLAEDSIPRTVHVKLTFKPAL